MDAVVNTKAMAICSDPCNFYSRCHAHVNSGLRPHRRCRQPAGADNICCSSALVVVAAGCLIGAGHVGRAHEVCLTCNSGAVGRPPFELSRIMWGFQLRYRLFRLYADMTLLPRLARVLAKACQSFFLTLMVVQAKGVADAGNAAFRVSGMELGGLFGSLLAGRISDALIARNPKGGNVGKRVQASFSCQPIAAGRMMTTCQLPIAEARLHKTLHHCR